MHPAARITRTPHCQHPRQALRRSSPWVAFLTLFLPLLLLALRTGARKQASGPHYGVHPGHAPHPQHVHPAQPAYQAGGAHGAPPGYGQGPAAVNVGTGAGGFERDHRRDSVGAGPAYGAPVQQAGSQHYGQPAAASAGFYGAERRGADDYRRSAVVDHRSGPPGAALPPGPAPYPHAGPAAGVYDRRNGGQPLGGGMGTPAGGYARGGVPLPPASVGGSSSGGAGYARDYRGSTTASLSTHGTPGSSVAGRSMAGPQAQDYRAAASTAGARGGYPANGSNRGPGVDHRAGHGAGMGMGSGSGAGAGGANGPVGGPGCVLMVYNLPRAKVGAQQLFNAFCMYGNVVRVKLLSKPENSAMVQMENAGCAAHAMEGLNRLPAFGVTVSVTTSRQTDIAPLRPGPNGDTEGVVVIDYYNSRENRFKQGSGPQHQPMKANNILYFGNVPGDAPDAEAYVRALLEKAGAPSPIKVTFLPPKEASQGGRRGRGAAPAPAPAPAPVQEAPGTEGTAPGETSAAASPAPAAAAGPAPRRSGFLEFADLSAAIEALLLANNVPIDGNRFPFKISFSGKTELKESGTSAKPGASSGAATSAPAAAAAGGAGEGSGASAHPPVRSRSRSRERTDATLAAAPSGSAVDASGVPEGVDDDDSDGQDEQAAAGAGAGLHHEFMGGLGDAGYTGGLAGAGYTGGLADSGYTAGLSQLEVNAWADAQVSVLAAPGQGQGLLGLHPAPEAMPAAGGDQAALEEAEDAATVDQEL